MLSNAFLRRVAMSLGGGSWNTSQQRFACLSKETHYITKMCPIRYFSVLCNHADMIHDGILRKAFYRASLTEDHHICIRLGKMSSDVFALDKQMDDQEKALYAIMLHLQGFPIKRLSIVGVDNVFDSDTFYTFMNNVAPSLSELCLVFRERPNLSCDNAEPVSPRRFWNCTYPALEHLSLVSQTYFDDWMFYAISKMFPGLTSIRMASNWFEQSDWGTGEGQGQKNALSAVIRPKSRERVHFDEMTSKIFFSSVRSNCPKLQTIDLQGVYMGFSSIFPRALSPSLVVPKTIYSVRDLKISGFLTLKSFNNLLGGLPKLERLDLRQCSFESKDLLTALQNTNFLPREKLTVTVIKSKQEYREHTLAWVRFIHKHADKMVLDGPRGFSVNYMGLLGACM
jgi:hypothetical protein